MRIPLVWLFGIIALVAFFLAALTRSNPRWEMLSATTTTAGFTLATLAAIAWQRESRWFWVGLSLVGWSYLLVAVRLGSRAHLATHVALVKLNEVARLTEIRRAPDGSMVYWTPEGEIQLVRALSARTQTRQQAQAAGLLPYAYPYNGAAPLARCYYNIGHYGWSWILGLAAGGVTYWLRHASRSRG